MKRDRHHNGFTLLELLTVVGVIGILVGLLLPAVQAAREAARRMSCSNNFRQVALGVAQYHDAFEILPPHGTGTFNNSNDPKTTNQFRLSFLVSITPFVGQRPLWEQLHGEFVGTEPGEFADEEISLEIDEGYDEAFMEATEKADHRYPSMGPAPSLRAYRPWEFEVPTFRCPSDPGIGSPGLGRTNYAACLGDAIEGLDQGLWRYENKQWSPSGRQQMLATGRGMFVPRMITSLNDVTDGLSNTIMLGEIATDLQDRSTMTLPSINNGWKGGVLDDIHVCSPFVDIERPKFWDVGSGQFPSANGQARGLRWADAMPLMSAVNTVLPPNSELCFGGDSTTIGTVTVSSHHQGGAHVALGDGAVIFMTDSVESGFGDGTVTRDGKEHLAPGSPSPHGLWGALGTRGHNELIEEELNQ